MKKSKLFVMGMAAIALTFTLVLTGCSNTTSSTPAPQALSGQVKISGTQAAGGTLTADTGALSGKGTLKYQWQESDTLGDDYSDISGGTASTYTVEAADVGKYFRVNVERTGYTGAVISSVVKIYADEASIPTVTGVTVTPTTGEVAQGKTQTFTVTVTGDTSNEVSWAVDSTVSSISVDGLLTVGADETKNTLKVTATSVADNTKSATADITVLLRLTGQVYEITYDLDSKDFPTSITYTSYTGSLTVEGNIIDTPISVTSGQLDITIKTPAVANLQGISELVAMFQNAGKVTSSDSSAKYFNLETSAKVGSTAYNFGKSLAEVKGNTVTSGQINYYYVDKDVTVKATGKKIDSKTTLNSFSLPLKKGWNTLYVKEDNSRNGNKSFSFSISNPDNLMWVIEPSSSGGGL